ncbi:hypothetical protein BB561_006173 [Smittium simulii]|uniref:PCI domain-containing protein n=1 Tax=Smittium simulii TaxID=133385 RepID=A0A2T9Y647_9FUNG|nr:hypothetical protein BB561_006173 [Smittium simulii]
MVNGKIPSQKLLKKYSELELMYSKFVIAYRTGNINLYDQNLQEMQSILFKSRTYLAVEKARELVLRTLFKKIHLILGSTRIAITTIQRVINLTGFNKCETELQCILAVQINKGLIKGYISETHNTLVLSKLAPFPLPNNETSNVSY